MENLPSRVSYVFRTARSVCSRTVDTPTDDLQCFPYVDLFVAGCNNIHRPLPSAPASHRHKRDFSTTFSNFQTLLAAFFPLWVHTDKPSDFFWKNLSYGSVGRCLQYCAHEREVWLPAQCRLSLCLFCAANGREAAHSLGVTQQNHQ